MSNFQRTAAWLSACGKGPESISVQIGCHIEEFVELVGCIESDNDDARRMLASAAIRLDHAASLFKKGLATAGFPESMRADALDALCDSEVTGNGIAYLAGFDKEEADIAVLDANDAKLVDGQPVILAGGKIGKPPGWVAPNLSTFV